MSTFELEEPVNPGYAATVIRIERLLPAQNADRLQLLPIMGMQAVVGLDTKVGDVGIIIPAMTQLSHEMCYYNNLYTHPEENKDSTQPKGYIEHHRRVKAIKLRGNRSDAIWFPLGALKWVFKKDKDFQAFAYDVVGRLKNGETVTFDKISDVEICRKYIKPVKGMNQKENKRQKVLNDLVEERLFPEHYNSPHFGMVSDQLDPETRIVITQKLHGTSVRIGYVPTVRKLTRLERLAKRWLKWPIAEHEYGMVYGSHHGIKGADAGNQRDFYDHDVWSEEGRKLQGIVPKNWILYGEIVGFTPSGAAIQPNYTYDCVPPIVQGVANSISIMEQWCTCRFAKITNPEKSTHEVSAGRATTENYANGIPNTRNDGVLENDVSTPQTGRIQNVETASLLAKKPTENLIQNDTQNTEGVAGSNASTASLSKSMKNSFNDRVASVPSADMGNPSNLTTTTSPEQFEGFSAEDAIGRSATLGILQTEFYVHSATCQVRQNFRLNDASSLLSLHNEVRKMYVYRIAVVNEDGIAVDLSWPAIKKWCNNNGVLHVPELEETWVGHFDFEEQYADKKFTEALGKTIPYDAQPVRLSEGSPCDEGVCLRVEGLTPYIIKAKSPEFVQHESHLKDTGAHDMEEDGVAPEELEDATV